MRINYHLSTNIWLHLEDFYNNGLTPEEAKKAIETVKDYTGSYLHCESSGFNGNWTVDTHSHHTDIPLLVLRIETVLYETMRRNNETRQIAKSSKDSSHRQ
jgi:hypothetical protein